MSKYDVISLKKQISMLDLLGRYGVDLKPKGSEWTALCPFHSEKSPSFTVFPDPAGDLKVYCFGCGASGDHIDMIKDLDGITTGEAIQRLAEIVGGSPVVEGQALQKQPQRKEKAPDEWQYLPAPSPQHKAPNTLMIERGGAWSSTPVVAAWPYHDALGDLHGYACRVEPEPGKKDVIPVCWMLSTKTGEAKWKQKSLPKPRLLYGAHQLAKNPKAQVIIAEGEKAADAGRRLLKGTGIIVIGWPGGGKAVKHADWASLAGRKVVGWPDCDSKTNHQTGEFMPYQSQPGMSAMLQIGENLPDNTQYKIVSVAYPGLIEDGYDLADYEADGADLAAIVAVIKSSAASYEEIQGMPTHNVDPNQAPEQETPQEKDPEQYDAAPEYYDAPAAKNDPVSDAEKNADPFRILGYNRSCCYYMPDGFRQVVALKTSDHHKLRLMELAPLSWWQSNFPSDKRSGDLTDWTLAAESLIRRSQRAGIWDEDAIRGRGAWWDQGRAAIHLGDRVVVDNVTYNLGDAPGNFVYELNTRIDLASGNPLTNSEACKVVDICENLRWKSPISGKLLAGWVFLAPICGALDWRPHVWITGGAGSGKSTIMKEIIHRVLKANMLFVQGETTEAGIRQELGHDALPVVFDEIESQSEKATARVNSIMDLMTIASSETGAKLVKGGANNKAMSYLIRSMFCFSSITVNLKQHAAKTRVTVLDMQQKPANESEEDMAQYNKMLDIIFTTMDDEYIRRLQARAVELVPVIRHNARIFAEAAALTVGSRRFGDQVGTLIAGAYALHSRNEVTPEVARSWIESQDWDEHDESTESKDERSCMQFLLGQHVRVDTEKGQKNRTIGELVEISTAVGIEDESISEEVAKATLRRHGIIVDGAFFDGGGSVTIANSHPMLEKMLCKSPWSTGWTRTLARLPGSVKTEGVNRYAGVASRGITIPISSTE
jgi:putative DNA primase/helicase